jgi:hypothetical protein
MNSRSRAGSGGGGGEHGSLGTRRARYPEFESSGD